MNATVQHLQDQNALLKAQRNNNVQIDEPSSEGTSLPPSKGLEQLETELQQLKLDNDRLRSQMEEKEKQIVSMVFTESVPMMKRNENYALACFAWL